MESPRCAHSGHRTRFCSLQPDSAPAPPQAPELFFGDAYGFAVDVYSFAIIMWELLTRGWPWAELNAADYLDGFAKLDDALRAGRRPAYAAVLETEHPVFVATMRACWVTEPGARPVFDAVVRQLSTGEPRAGPRQDARRHHAAAHGGDGTAATANPTFARRDRAFEEDAADDGPGRLSAQSA